MIDRATASIPLVMQRRLLIAAAAASPISSLPTKALDRELSSFQKAPPNAVMVPAGSDIQAMVDRSPEGTVFCLGSGIHKAQTIRPKDRQSFFGQGKAILTGSQLVTGFTRDDVYWAADYPAGLAPPHGQCFTDTPTCNLAEAVFVHDTPLLQVRDRAELARGRFLIDHAHGRLYLADDPRGEKVEAALFAAAFEGTARNVEIADLIVEKYATPAQKGAIHARRGAAWTIRNCEVRLNTGGGIAVGEGTHIDLCDIHHNGQIGITGVGNQTLIENSRIWANNTRGFDYRWEAGGAKLALSEGVTLRGNYVHDNFGPGLWCDIDCRNILYERNRVEANADSGIFHEISFRATIRNNLVRHNGNAHRRWFWGADIVVAASQDVEIYDNTVVSSPGRCSIMLIDQGRPTKDGRLYKTRNDRIYNNEITFEGVGCAGGASDTPPESENFLIIEEGGNEFDGNHYRVPKASGPFRFAWGHHSFTWNEIRRMGIEAHGQLVRY